MATLSHTPWWFKRPQQLVATKEWFGFRGPSPRTPAHDRPGLAPFGRYARVFGPRLLIG